MADLADQTTKPSEMIHCIFYRSQDVRWGGGGSGKMMRESLSSLGSITRGLLESSKAREDRHVVFPHTSDSIPPSARLKIVHETPVSGGANRGSGVGLLGGGREGGVARHFTFFCPGLCII